MKTFTKLLLGCAIVTIMTGLAGCHDSDDPYDKLPTEITSFINEYFPGIDVQSVTHTSSGWHVQLRGGAGMTFDENERWTSVTGYGAYLPQVLLFDQLYPSLYSYLQANGDEGKVYAITRDYIDEKAVLDGQTVVYTIANGAITQVTSTPVTE